MKDVITSRLQLFLAKIAGRSVSESTLTPPVVSNMEEKLLDEIAGRLDTIEGQSRGLRLLVAVAKSSSLPAITRHGSSIRHGRKFLTL